MARRAAITWRLTLRQSALRQWVLASCALALAACGGGQRSTEPAPAISTAMPALSASATAASPSKVSSVEQRYLRTLLLTPGDTLLSIGSSRQFKVTGIYSDRSYVDFTGLVTWSSSDAQVVAMARNGLASALAPGSVKITASTSGLSRSTELTIIPVALRSISVSPNASRLNVGLKQKLVVTGVYADGDVATVATGVRWTSSAPGIASIGVGGVLQAYGEGRVTITAHVAGLTGSATLQIVPMPTQSRYFDGDAEADALRAGRRVVTMPTVGMVDDFGLQWRLANAMLMLGMESASIARGQTIGAAAFADIDRRLAIREALFDADVARLPHYADNWAPQFNNNLPRSFAVSHMVRTMDLFNSGPRQYQRLNNRCMLANLVPMMCGVLADFGTNDGRSCREGQVTLRDPQIVQMPDLQWFNGVRRTIHADDPPTSPFIPSACLHAVTLAHEFAHELDNRFWPEGSASGFNQQFDRFVECGPAMFDLRDTPHPFTYNGANGQQVAAEFVSGYASGLANNGTLDYRSTEDLAESVAAYMMFPEYFREHAARDTALQARYDHIRWQLFGGAEFQNRVIADVSAQLTPPNGTVAELCFQIKEFRLDDIVLRH